MRVVKVAADKLKEARKRSGRTQQQVADEIGVHFTTLSQWENGHRQPDDIGHLIAYAAAVRVGDFRTLLEGDVPADDDLRAEFAAALLPIADLFATLVERAREQAAKKNRSAA